MDKEKSLALVYVSCDRYSDIWPFLFRLKEQYWPDCPFPTYLVTNYAQPEFPSVTVIPVGADLSWSSNLINALRQIPEDYVLLSVEDLLPSKPPDSKAILEIWAWFRRHDANCFCLQNNYNGNAIAPHVYEIPPGALYRASTVKSLWRKEVLLQVLDNRENAWQFEIVGSQRTSQFPGFYYTDRNVLPTINSVIKGVWTRPAVRWLRAQGLSIDEGRRPVMNRKQQWKFRLLVLRAHLFHLVPVKHRWKIRMHFYRKSLAPPKRVAP